MSGYDIALERSAPPDSQRTLFVSNGLMAIGVIKSDSEVGTAVSQDGRPGHFDDLALV